MQLDSRVNKSEWRNHFKDLRDGLSDHERTQWESQIQKNLVNLLSELSAEKVASYRSFGSEVSLDELHKNSGFQWAFPRVEGENLKFCLSSDLESFDLSPMKILEPTSEAPEIPLNECDAVIVPGVAFDRSGGRLGYGRGFYDRALGDYSGIKIGVAYKKQICNESLPTSEMDKWMDYVVTEDFVLRPLYQKRN